MRDASPGHTPVNRPGTGGRTKQRIGEGAPSVPSVGQDVSPPGRWAASVEQMKQGSTLPYTAQVWSENGRRDPDDKTNAEFHLVAP